MQPKENLFDSLMRSFITLLIASLLVTTVATGLMAFLLPFDIRVTRMHAVAAPVFGLFVVWHAFHNRRSLYLYLSSKHHVQLLAAAVCTGVLAALLYFNTFPASAWMSLSYEQRRADAIFRPSQSVVTRRLNGLIDVKRLDELVGVQLAADLTGDATDPPDYTVIWMEDDQGRLLDTLYLSEELAFRDTIDVDGVPTSRRDVLPVWWHRWQTQKAAAEDELPDGVDAIARPTVKVGFDFAALVESQQPRFNLMLEISRTGSVSQVYAAMVDLDRFKRYYLTDLLGLGTQRGTLSYDTTELTLNDLLVDKVLITIDDNRSVTP